MLWLFDKYTNDIPPFSNPDCISVDENGVIHWKFIYQKRFDYKVKDGEFVLFKLKGISLFDPSKTTSIEIYIYFKESYIWPSQSLSYFKLYSLNNNLIFSDVDYYKTNISYYIDDVLLDVRIPTKINYIMNCQNNQVNEFLMVF